MQQTFMSVSNLRVPDMSYGTPSAANESQYGGGKSGNGFDNTQTTFKHRTTSVSKPVDRQVLEDFKTLCEGTKTSQWNKRVAAIGEIEDFAGRNAGKIRASQASFIGLVDAYCSVLQDNNAKVLARAQQSFRVLVQVPQLHGLFVANLTMLVQALTTNLCSTAPQVRAEGEHLMDLLEMACLEEARNVNAMVQPVVS